MSLTPIGRRLEPQEIPPLVVYLASREASVITGQPFNIDGGLSTPRRLLLANAFLTAKRVKIWMPTSE